MTAPESGGNRASEATQIPPSQGPQQGQSQPPVGQHLPVHLYGQQPAMQSQGPGAGKPSLKAPRKPLPPGVKFGVAGLILGILIGTAGTSIATAAIDDARIKAAAEAEANKPRPLPEAVGRCKLSSETVSAKLGDDGHSLSLDSEGEDDYSGLSMTQVDCVLEALNMPDSINDQMGTTRALDGTQRDSWDNFSVSWNYHPDSGLHVNLRETTD